MGCSSDATDATGPIQGHDPHTRIISLPCGGENQAAMAAAGASLLLTPKAAFEELCQVIHHVPVPAAMHDTGPAHRSVCTGLVLDTIKAASRIGGRTAANKSGP